MTYRNISQRIHPTSHKNKNMRQSGLRMKVLKPLVILCGIPDKFEFFNNFHICLVFKGLYLLWILRIVRARSANRSAPQKAPTLIIIFYSLMLERSA